MLKYKSTLEYYSLGFVLSNLAKTKWNESDEKEENKIISFNWMSLLILDKYLHKRGIGKQKKKQKTLKNRKTGNKN